MATGGTRLAPWFGMMNVTAKRVLSNELATIRAAIAAHEARIQVEIDAADTAANAFYNTFGCEPWDATEYAVGWTAAIATVTTMRDETGYFWAMSRVRDLVLILNGGRLVHKSTESWGDWHVVGLGTMPRSDASVGPWVSSVFGLAAAA